jgi:tetratricopeptide (TPR) repeat protein
MRFLGPVLPLALLTLGTLGTAAAQTIDPVAQYRDCLALAAEAPEQALELAGQFEGLGGGLAARHCRAAAWAAMGKSEAAAKLLEQLAQEERATAAVKAGLLRQAARAWMEAGQTARAAGVLDAALAVTPGDADLLEDRALVRAEAGDAWAAVDDLNQALEAEPERVSSLVLRAAAYRRLKALDLARADLDRAAAVAPETLDILLERGHLALAEGHPDAARDQWMTLLRRAPDGPPATAAREALEAMDVRSDAEGISRGR